MERLIKEIEKLSLEELVELHRLITQRAKALTFLQRAEATAKFQAGQKVKFIRKKGQEIIGTVKKVNPTTVDVLCSGEVWRVAANLLSHSE